MPIPKRSTEEDRRLEAGIARHNRMFAEISKDTYIERVSGDYMFPYLKNGDHVLVDPDNDSLADGICCFEFIPGEPMIARVQLIPDGSTIDGKAVPSGVRIFGDNKLYRDSFITSAKARLAIRGRVRTLMINV